MTRRNRYERSTRSRALQMLPGSSLLFFLLTLLGCAGSCRGAPSPEQLASIEFAPQRREDFENSTPEKEGLDPSLVARLFHDAKRLPDIDSLLLVKNGRLIAEKYFHEGSIDTRGQLQSVSKSYTSALVGLAIEQGCIESVRQPMMDFFPEQKARLRDPRKLTITVGQMLEMRAGYPWEESSGELFDVLFSGFRPHHVVDVPLNKEPGSAMEYSNLTTYLLGVIVTRACGRDLAEFAFEHLHDQMGVMPGKWDYSWENYRLGFVGLHMRPRDLAKFGQLYLDGGTYRGRQILPEEWVQDSLAARSDDAWRIRVGKNFTEPQYGYQWWRIKAGAYRYNLAWGHGGQQIALVHELELVIVVTADPLFKKHGGGPWKREKRNLNLVADFVARLPAP